MAIYVTQKTNKYHKPVTLILSSKPMLKFKNPVSKDLNIVMVVDRSGSMASYKNEVVNAVNNQIRIHKEQAKAGGYNAKVAIVTFNEYPSLDIPFTAIDNAGEIDPVTFEARGNTALYDAIAHGIINIQLKEGRSLVIVIADGEENSSKTYNLASIASWIKTQLARECVTFAFCVPPGRKYLASQFGLTPESFMEWEGSVQGAVKMDNAIYSGTRSLYSSYNAGATYSTNYFAPQLDNLNPQVVDTNLDEVTSKYNVHTVNTSNPESLVISNFVNSIGKSYSPGKAYYELTKKEKVQDYKNVVLLDKDTRKLYTGANIRSLLGIPNGGTIELNPSFNPKYKVFVKSMSWNRKLVNGTQVLYPS